jgi:hypothetical protein
LFFGPRVALALIWLMTDWYVSFSSSIVALLGFIFLPWTSLAWMYTYFHNNGAATGIYVLLIVAGAIADLSAVGGHRHYKRWRETD